MLHPSSGVKMQHGPLKRQYPAMSIHVVTIRKTKSSKFKFVSNVWVRFCAQRSCVQVDGLFLRVKYRVQDAQL